jgi:hypothetical protein
MGISNCRPRCILSFSLVIGAVAGALSTPGCTPDQLIAELPDGSSPQTPPGNDGSVTAPDGQMSSDAPAEEDARNDATDIPTCSVSQVCAEFTPEGPACLPGCAGLDAGGCAAGEVCTSTSGCCLGTGCSAVTVFACCPPAGCNTRPDAGAPTDAGVFPSCSADQRCVEYTPEGPGCLPGCAGLDAGGCAAGEVCTSTSGCCLGTACSAVSVFACCPPAGCDTRPDAGAP